MSPRASMHCLLRSSTRPACRLIQAGNLSSSRHWPAMSSTATQTSTAPRSAPFTLDDVNPHVRDAKYAVRGELAVRAEKYRQQLSRGSDKLPFDSVISANIGNPQQLNQKPITFFRQVASLLENPELLENEKGLVDVLRYPPDVLQRARTLLADVKSVGAYSHSQGAPGIRRSVADFIERRDGYAADPDSIFLTAGASGAVNLVLNVLCANDKSGVLVPMPQYPLYTATLALLGARAAPYYLDEAAGWSTDLGAMQQALDAARAQGTDVRAIVVINPGNPTGATLTAADVSGILKFAHANGLVVLADEVYQTNIFSGEFTSFKRALRDLQATSSAGTYDALPLVSMHSISKGMVGECGHRGGYMELVNVDADVAAQMYKLASVSLCPPVLGQCLVELMVNPPAPGEPSHALYAQEYTGVANGLKDRAFALHRAFSAMEGVDCQPPTGSMYLYPTIKLPPGALEAARAEGRDPDEFYVSKMLDATGVCMVAGSGFGQVEGTFHFRTTFLPEGTEWVGRLERFHREFMQTYT